MAAALSKLRSADSAYVQTAMAMTRATFVIGFFVWKIFGWRVSHSMTASFRPTPSSMPSAAAVPRKTA